MSNLQTPVSTDLTLPSPASNGGSPLGGTLSGSVRRAAVAEEALEDDPDNPLLWNILGTVIRPGELAVVAGRTYTKQQCFERALEVDPDDTVAWNNLGELDEDEVKETNKNDADERGSNKDSSSGLEAGFLTPSRPRAPTTLNSTTNTPSNATTTGSLPPSPSKKDCFIKALEIHPDHSQAWSNLGRQIPIATAKSGDSVVTVGDRSYTKQQCYERALDVDPRNGSAWYSLAELAPPPSFNNKASGTISYHSSSNNTDVKMTKKQCFEKALEFDPNHPSAWLQLADTIIPAADVATVGGREYTKQECVERALETHPGNAAAWCSLISFIPNAAGGTVTLNGKTLTRQACFEKLLGIDGKRPLAWFNLGNELPSGGSAMVGRVPISKQQCYENAVEVDPRNAAAWNSLGSEMKQTGGMGDNSNSVAAKMTLTKQQCFIHALEVDPRHALAWYNLGLCISNTGTEVVEVSGEELTKANCFEKVLELHPRHTSAWADLAHALDAAYPTAKVANPFQGGKKGSSNVVATYSTYTKQQCIEKHVELRPRDADGWVELISIIRANQAVAVVGGLRHSLVQCYEKLLEIDGKQSSAWLNLGNELPTGGSATVGKTSVSKRRCYEKAVDPGNADAWNSLGILLVESSSDYINNDSFDTPTTTPKKKARMSYNPEKCFIRSVSSNPTSSAAWNNAGLYLLSTQKNSTNVNGAGTASTSKENDKNGLNINDDNDGTKGLIAASTLWIPVPQGGAEACTTQDCFVKAVELNPLSSNAWNNLGTSISRDSDGAAVSITTTTDAGSKSAQYVVTKVDCYTRAVELNPTHAVAWSNLGSVVSSAGNDNGAGVVIVGGDTFTRLQCIEKSLLLSGGGAGTLETWINAFNTISTSSTIFFIDESLSKNECALKILDLYYYSHGYPSQQPHIVVAVASIWAYLGDTMATAATNSNTIIVVNGKEYTQKVCYEIALTALLTSSSTPPSPTPSTPVVSGGPDTTTTTTGSNNTVTESALYLSTMQSLGDILHSTDGEHSVATVKGRQLSKVQCYTSILEATSNRRNTAVWNNLGLALGSSNGTNTDREKKTTMIGGETYNEQRCYETSLGFDPEDEIVWSNLGITLGGEGKALVGGQEFTQEECFQRADEIFASRAPSSQDVVPALHNTDIHDHVPTK